MGGLIQGWLNWIDGSEPLAQHDPYTYTGPYINMKSSHKVCMQLTNKVLTYSWSGYENSSWPLCRWGVKHTHINWEFFHYSLPNNNQGVFLMQNWPIVPRHMQYLSRDHEGKIFTTHRLSQQTITINHHSKLLPQHCKYYGLTYNHTGQSARHSTVCS